MGGRQWAAAVATTHVCLFTCGTLKDVNCVAQRNIIMCLWWFGVGAGQMREVGRSVGCVIIYLIECVALALGWTVPPPPPFSPVTAPSSIVRICAKLCQPCDLWPLMDVSR